MLLLLMLMLMMMIMTMETYRILKAHRCANGFKMPINETKYASSPLLSIIHVKLDKSLWQKSLIRCVLCALFCRFRNAIFFFKFISMSLTHYHSHSLQIQLHRFACVSAWGWCNRSIRFISSEIANGRKCVCVCVFFCAVVVVVFETHSGNMVS